MTIFSSMLSLLDKLLLADCALPLIVKDGTFDDLAGDVHDEARHYFSENRESFQRAAVGGVNRTSIVDQRGDLRCWVTPSLCSSHNLVAIPALVKRLISWCKDFKEPLHLNAEYSVQLTCYPGNGARYVKHRDAFQHAAHASDPEHTGHRKLTFICYLNKEWDGGSLRAHFSPAQAAVSPGSPPFVDIEPALGRVVAFRGDVVEHEVLPSFQDRFAITLWAYSSTPPSAVAIAATPPTYAPLPCPPVYWDRRIFVSVANYRDSEGLRTILQLLLTARNPHRVFIGHVFQGEPEERLHDFSGIRFADLPPDIANCLQTNLRCLLLPANQATGPCFARHLAQKLWQGEEYFLQIDSHMRFRSHWDDYLIDLLEDVRIRENCSKPILTTYPMGYQLPNVIPADVRPTVLVPSKFGEDGMLRQSAKVVDVQGKPVSYFKSSLWASGFSFSDSRVLQDVEYSPHLPQLFFGEEALMAARLFTNGYDFYAPGQAVVYHLYSRQHRPVFNTTEPASGANDKEADKKRSQAVVAALMSTCALDSEDPAVARMIALNKLRYGLGNERTVADFQENCGVDFSAKLIARPLSKALEDICLTADTISRIAEVRFATDIAAEDDRGLHHLKREMLGLVPEGGGSAEGNLMHLLNSFLK